MDLILELPLGNDSMVDRRACCSNGRTTALLATAASRRARSGAAEIELMVKSGGWNSWGMETSPGRG